MARPAVLVVALALAIAALLTACGPGPSESAGPRISPAEQRRQEIAERLAGDPGERQEGIALAVLVDVSGSMEQKVRVADGRKEPKIAIAQRATIQLLERIVAFTDEHPDKPVVCGVWEFSQRGSQRACREVVPMGVLDIEAAERGVLGMEADGGTPIGAAMITAKRQLDATGMSKRHLLVVTDGENTDGYSPEHVAEVIAGLPLEDQASIYFVAFDVAADRFDGVKEQGGIVLGAADAPELENALDYLLTGKILAEAPSVPRGR